MVIMPIELILPMLLILPMADKLIIIGPIPPPIIIIFGGDGATATCRMTKARTV